MTKLEQAIEYAKSLPPEKQAWVADTILSYQNDTFELTEAELQEVDCRLASAQAPISGETVFARLRKKYGAV